MFVYLPVEYHQSLHSFPTRRSSDLAEALTRSNELTRGKKATLFFGLFLTQLSATAVVLLVSYLGGLVHGFFGFVFGLAGYVLIIAVSMGSNAYVYGTLTGGWPSSQRRM